MVNSGVSCPPKGIHLEGSGYLIPRPAQGYPDTCSSVPPGILGTALDSCSLHEEDLSRIKESYNQSDHTKLTKMTGGPLPPPSGLSFSEGSATPPFVCSLLDQLKIQLSRNISDPIY
ncbi:hypothetical protein CVT26_000976 [Gymnopilus dilepis]|uniref:Uncharacterized protein n=1 Tax=Gymnopilus dilepis TaxID=231916 RepID=A0A409WB37_9AGAR|nr:hypothetical protein CVT26_000976 [Gymnopilus dilepis]